MKPWVSAPYSLINHQLIIMDLKGHPVPLDYHVVRIPNEELNVLKKLGWLINGNNKYHVFSLHSKIMSKICHLWHAILATGWIYTIKVLAKNFMLRKWNISVTTNKKV